MNETYPNEMEERKGRTNSYMSNFLFWPSQGLSLDSSDEEKGSLFLAWRSCIAGVNIRDEEREEDEALDLDFAAAAFEGVEWEEDMFALVDAAWGGALIVEETGPGSVVH